LAVDVASRLSGAKLSQRGFELAARIGGISKDMAQPGECAAHRGKQLRCAVAVLDVSPMHDGGDEQPHGVDQQMTLAAVNLLTRVVAAWTTRFGGLHRLAVDHPGRRTRRTPWVVERTIAWLNRNRRLAKDFEATLESAQAWLLIASVKLLSRRLART